MNKFILQSSVITLLWIAACAASAEQERFVFAGVKGAVADTLSATWSYGIRMSTNPDSIARIKLSCDPIPGSTFTVRGEDIKPASGGVVFLDGPVFLVSEETTPWLYGRSETRADCKALIIFHDHSKTKIHASVRFSGTQKAVTLAELESAHAHNKDLGGANRAGKNAPGTGSKKATTAETRNIETVVKNTDSFKSMFSGKTVSGRHVKKGFGFKAYFAEDGKLLERRDNGKHKEGSWSIDEQDSLCIRWKNQEACGQLKSGSDGSVSFMRKGIERRRYEHFVTGNTL